MSGDTPNREEWLDEVLEEVFAFGGLPKYQRLAEAKAQILAHYAPKPIVTPDTHEHKFLMPVRWAYLFYGDEYIQQTPHSKVVTKLRCECGEEIDR